MKLTQRDLANCAVLPEVDPDVEKLLRGLVTLDWKDAELPKVLELFKDLSKGRRETARHTGEYLDTLARPGRVPKIVIAGLEGGPRSTGLDAVEGQSPESNPVALIKLKSIASARSFLEKQTAKRDPFSFRLDYVVLEFVKSEKPPKHTPNRKVKMRSWKRMQLAGDHLMETLADHAIRDVDPDTGKEYYARRMGQKLRKGKRDPENPKDSPIRKELYLLRRALEWFFGTRDITERIPTFTMPAFLELEVQFFTYDEFMRLMWACLGWDFEKGLRVKIDPAMSRWLIRFFVLYFLTGTRYDANSKMVWGYNDFVGCIDLENGHIWRNGGKAPKSKTKPRKRSDLTAMVLRILRRWYRLDRIRAQERNVPWLYVIHEGGKFPRNFTDKVDDALLRSGVGKTAHKCKSGGITLLGLAGYLDEEIAGWYGNAENTVAKSYKNVDWKKNRRERPTRKPIEEFTWADLKKVSPPTLNHDQVAMLKADLRARGHL